VLEVVGSLFFAGARTLAESLPSVAGSTRAAVVLRLRGRTRAGATLIEVLDDYADDLAESGGRLFLSGVDERLATQLRLAGKLDLERSVQLVPARNVLGASTLEAVAEASAWLAGTRSDPRTQ
jgi:SulP family sulfate permease